MRGYGYAAVSILLISLSQLLFRLVMSHFSALPRANWHGWPHSTDYLLALLLGIMGYGLSMLCWFKALHQRPLSQLYPLTSLSYILVWLCAPYLPEAQESHHWSDLAGIGLILLGVLFVSRPTLGRKIVENLCPLRKGSRSERE